MLKVVCCRLTSSTFALDPVLALDRRRCPDNKTCTMERLRFCLESSLFDALTYRVSPRIDDNPNDLIYHLIHVKLDRANPASPPKSLSIAETEMALCQTGAGSSFEILTAWSHTPCPKLSNQYGTNAPLISLRVILR